MPKRDLDLERKWRKNFDEYKKSGVSGGTQYVVKKNQL
jgi:hypothetical protein